MLIEDNNADATAIAETLSPIADVRRFSSLDVGRFLRLKAEQPGIRVAIVDLALEGTKRAYAGIGIIEKLWGIDRTMTFIVHSGYLDVNEDGIRSFLRPEQIRPSMALIPKSREAGGRLNTDGLGVLRAAVQDAINVSLPLLRLPRGDRSEWLYAIDDFEKQRGSSVASLTAVRRALGESQRVMQRLQEEAIDLWCAGRPSYDMGVGVYGSCGRGEIRAQSDIELSAFFSSAAGGVDVRRLCAVAWARTALACRKLKHRPEGTSLLDEASIDERFGSQALRNGFMPVIDTDALFRSRSGGKRAPGSSATLARRVRSDPAAARLKQLQILAELKPIFNPRLILDLQVKVLRQVFAEPQYARDLLPSERLGSLVRQLDLETEVARILDKEDVKDVALRLLSLLSLRLELVRCNTTDVWQRNEESDYGRLVQRLGAPGIVKVARFSSEALGAGEPYGSVTAALVLAYSQLLERFFQHFDESTAAGVQHFVADLKEVVDLFVTVFSEISETERGSAIHSRGAWVLETMSLKQLSKKL